ncbi:MAG: hypothetical protein LBC97_13225 [Bifidobacteriaceae bacterium]|jgi:hypothetical protein|nr:hypothetical protein [Bifidobacteriaceae bacterium]
MIALARLGLLLIRAGGPLRACSIVIGNAVAVVALLATVGLVNALGMGITAFSADAMASTSGMVVLIAAPAIALVITAGRLSSGVRDRRLGAIRKLGLGPDAARAAAVVENGVPALAGAGVGVGLFNWVFVPLTATVGALPGSFALRAWPQAAVVGLVVAGSVAVGVAATWEREMPGWARTESKRRTPHAWRPFAFAFGIVPLAWVATASLGPGQVPSWQLDFAFLWGLIVTGVGLVFVIPWLTGWLARALARSSVLSLKLAGRAIETDPASASRIVAGMGVALCLTIGGLAALREFEAEPYTAAAIHAYMEGPQFVSVTAWPTESPDRPDVDPLNPAALAELNSIPGVLGLAPLRLPIGCTEEGHCQGGAWVGTCARLELVRAVSGCDDSQAAIIEASPEAPGDESWEPALDTTVWRRGQEISVWAYGSEGSLTPLGRVTIAPEPIILDANAEVNLLVPSGDRSIFVPESLLDTPPPPDMYMLVGAEAGGAVIERIGEWARSHGYNSWGTGEESLRAVQLTRTVIWSLSGTAIGIALLAFALGAADRARERRRAVGRQVMLGVPGRVLRWGQLLQVLLPILVSVAAALATGLLALAAFNNLKHMAATPGARYWWLLLGLSGGAALLVSLSTLPLIRTRITPDLLRRE